MRILSLILATVFGGAVLSGAATASACDRVMPSPEQLAAGWVAYRDQAQAIFVGQVVAMRPYSRAERRVYNPVRISGEIAGDQLGWADVAPVETLQGRADGLAVRYSNGRVCDVDLWYPRVGDFVLVVRDKNGVPHVHVGDEIGDPVLRARVQSYAALPAEPAGRE